MHWEELSAELTVDEKLGIIKTEYSIPVDDKLRRDVSATIFLSGLKELETLTIVHMNIDDLGAISEITSLRWIALGCTGITDIMPLRKLENLKFIGIYGNKSEAVTEQAGQYFKNVDGLDVDVSEELPITL